MVKARTWIARFFRYMVVFRYNADVNSRRSGSVFARVRGRCLRAVGCLFSQGGEREGGRERGRFFPLSHLWAVASRHARVNCRCSLAEQFFWSRDVSRWAFVSRVPCVSKGLGSKIVCSID